MQLVAAAKMKKAQDQALAGRDYARLLNQVLGINEAEFLRELNLFGDGDSLVDSIFDNIEADISFSAGAHMGATGKEKQKCSLYWNFNRTDSLMLLQHDLL